jgi:hypothetical protein
MKFRYEQDKGMKLELLGVLAIQYLSYCYDLELRFAKLSKAYTLSEQNIEPALSLLHSIYQTFLIVISEVHAQLMNKPFNNVWVKEIGKLINKKLLKSDNNSRLYKLHNEAVITLLKKIRSQYEDNKFFKIIITHAENLSKITYTKLRQTLCNELFYFVLLNIEFRQEIRLNYRLIQRQE